MFLQTTGFHDLYIVGIPKRTHNRFETRTQRCPHALQHAGICERHQRRLERLKPAERYASRPISLAMRSE